MLKKIYIISDKEDIRSLLPFFEELQRKNFSLSFFFSNPKLIKLKEEKKIKIKKITKILNDGGKIKNLTLKFIAPFLSLILIPYLFYLKRKKNIQIFILWSKSAKIILRIPLKFIKIKNIWIENDFSEKKLRTFSKKTIRLCFSNEIRNQLIKSGVKKEQIKLLLPALHIKDTKRQDNIFNNLARENWEKNQSISKKSNFFSIGTFADLNSETNLENIFLAIKKSLDVIPNIQLIIIGDGKNRKELTWLSQKMKINNLVWFIGEQKHLGKWLEAFDLFIPACLKANLKDFEIILKILYAKIPVISPNNIGLNDLIKNNKTGIITEKENSEEILKAIIKLKKDNDFRKQLGHNSFLSAQENFNIGRMINDFIKIIEE